MYLLEYLESLETLHFLEFNKQTVDIVGELYLDEAKILPGSASIFCSTRRYGASIPEHAIDDDDYQWWSAMQAIGVTSKFGHRIMEERHREMRLSSTLKETIIDMVEMRCEFRESLEDLIKTCPKITKFEG
ncbi:hypothetical protein MMC34_007173 [Xylographa carneopallida]|nr:hypothetical protein [Xylographa carneopallida]